MLSGRAVLAPVIGAHDQGFRRLRDAAGFRLLISMPA
jgi:hypothetical protein